MLSFIDGAFLRYNSNLDISSLSYGNSPIAYGNYFLKASNQIMGSKNSHFNWSCVFWKKLGVKIGTSQPK